MQTIIINCCCILDKTLLKIDSLLTISIKYSFIKFHLSKILEMVIEIFQNDVLDLI